MRKIALPSLVSSLRNASGSTRASRARSGMLADHPQHGDEQRDRTVEKASLRIQRL